MMGVIVILSFDFLHRVGAGHFQAIRPDDGPEVGMHGPAIDILGEELAIHGDGDFAGIRVVFDIDGGESGGSSGEAGDEGEARERFGQTHREEMWREREGRDALAQRSMAYNRAGAGNV
jgi:hypothetical protein